MHETTISRRDPGALYPESTERRPSTIDSLVRRAGAWCRRTAGAVVAEHICAPPGDAETWQRSSTSARGAVTTPDYRCPECLQRWTRECPGAGDAANRPHHS